MLIWWPCGQKWAGQEWSNRGQILHLTEYGQAMNLIEGIDETITLEHFFRNPRWPLKGQKVVFFGDGVI